MIWLFKKFWSIIGLIGFFIGSFFIPINILDRQNAVRAWGQVFTMGNREILLVILFAACLFRLLYLDLRRAVNDKDWPPVRRKLLKGLGVLFKKDVRQAELSKISGDDELKRLKEEVAADKVEIANQNKELHIEVRRYLKMLEADHKLKVFDQQCGNISLPQVPTQEELERRGQVVWSEFSEHCFDQARHIRRAESASASFLREGAFSRIEEAGRQVSPVRVFPEEERVLWPNNSTRIQWLSTKAQIDRYNVERDAAKGALISQTKDLSRASAIERILLLLPEDVE